MIDRKRANGAIKRLRRELRQVRSHREFLRHMVESQREDIANAKWREQHLLKEYHDLKGVDFDEIDRLNGVVH